MNTSKPYLSWQNFPRPSRQQEYTEPARLLSPDGRLLVRGWARRNVFDYDRNDVKAKAHRKEWDFYQISDGHYMVQVNFANITLGGYVSTTLVDLQAGKVLCSSASYFVGARRRYPLPAKGDIPNRVAYKIGGAEFEFVTEETSRTLYYKKGAVELSFRMDRLPGQENITTVLPFEGRPDRYFMTTKENCLPCEGTFTCPDGSYRFSKDSCFCVMDWGRVCTPYRLVWYWGNGSCYLTDDKGQRHLFGFEITWGIGCEEAATETCLFFDGKAHKIGAVDVEVFPKPDGYMKPWRFVSEDGRFNLTMQPFYDHHSDLNVGVLRMHSHQVHGLWSGTVTLDDGTVLGISDMYAFCEYVENRW